jgi:hypothetical protein
MDADMSAGAFLGPRGATLPMAILRGTPPHVHAAVWRGIESGAIVNLGEHLVAGDDKAAATCVVTCDNFNDVSKRCTPDEAAVLMAALRDAAAAADPPVSFELVWPTTLSCTLRGTPLALEDVYDAAASLELGYHLCFTAHKGCEGETEVEWTVDCSNDTIPSRCYSVREAEALIAAVVAAAAANGGGRVTCSAFAPPPLPQPRA